MPFRPSIDTGAIAPMERLTIMAQSRGFRECAAGDMIVTALEKERARALAIVRREDSSREAVARANGALDVLEFMLDEGMRLDALVEKDMR